MHKNIKTAYYLVEDSSNFKERGDIESLRAHFRLVTIGFDGVAPIDGVKHIRVDKMKRSVFKAIFIWSKLCFLLARISTSQSDYNFPLRNMYTGTPLVRKLINVFWGVKRSSVINGLLPRYETAFFFPFVVFYAIRRLPIFLKVKNFRRAKKNRIFIHDSLAIRLVVFAPIISKLILNKEFRVANVKSWDNPFYSQFCTNANAYLVWSKFMSETINYSHGVSVNSVAVWGARPFMPFVNECRRSVIEWKLDSERIVIGYAAAFSEPIMAAYEIDWLLALSSYFSKENSKIVIHVRPYPILKKSIYLKLNGISNIVLQDIEGEITDRYGDGRELIKFGSNRERISYLSKCTCFLSLATSFSIEAAIFGLPVIQFKITEENVYSDAERELYTRISISDHILEYFYTSFFCVDDFKSLAGAVECVRINKDKYIQKNSVLLSKVGIPKEGEDWLCDIEPLLAIGP